MLDDAINYLARQGGRFVAVERASKKPVSAGWQNKPLTANEVGAHVAMGGNVGLLTGSPSNGLVVLDIDYDFLDFIAAFPHLGAGPRIVRTDDLTRGKLLLRITDDIPAPRKWKPYADKPPHAELLSTGNHALIPPSVHPGGCPFELRGETEPIPAYTRALLDALWEQWTQEPAPPASTAALQENLSPDIPLPSFWKGDIRARLDMVAYACDQLGATAQRESADEVRILGQGGLLINTKKQLWNTFGIDGTGTIGGDCFALIGYLEYGDPHPRGNLWQEVLFRAADLTGIYLPPYLTKGYPDISVRKTAGNEPGTPRGESTPTRQEQALPLYYAPDLWHFQGNLQQVMEGWMLAGNITLIGGVPNVGKSPLLMALVAGYAQGEWLHGVPMPDDFKGRGVVYCLPEGYAEQTRLLDTWGVDPEWLATRLTFPALPTPGDPDSPTFTFKLDSEEGRAVLAHYCEQMNPALIIIDGLRAGMSGEESSSGDCDRFFAPLIHLAQKHRAAVIITHHLTKGAETLSRSGQLPSIDWFRGSGHIVAACRSAWIVDQPNAHRADLRRITLVKAAAGAKGQTLGFSMNNPADGITFGQAVPQAQPDNKKEAAKQFILDLLAEGQMTFKELCAAARDHEESFGDGTLRDARVELAAAGLIVYENEGRLYYWRLPNEQGEADERYQSVGG